ncbi:hypothetical protein IJI31_04685 [bacterium]|nr:hypothetical protein [bacterium]
MNNIQFGMMTSGTSGIDYDAIAATKEAIFKRASAKAAEIEKNMQGSYRSDLKNDVMRMARESIKETPGNPFKEKTFAKPETEPTETEKRLVEDNSIPKLKKVGRFDNTPYKLSLRDETMAQARRDIAGNDRLSNLLSSLNSKVAFQNSAYKPANLDRYK